MSNRWWMLCMAAVSVCGVGCSQNTPQPVLKSPVPLAVQEDYVRQWLEAAMSTTQPTSSTTQPTSQSADGPAIAVTVKFVSSHQESLRQYGLLGETGREQGAREIVNLDDVLASLLKDPCASVMTAPQMKLRSGQVGAMGMTYALETQPADEASPKEAKVDPALMPVGEHVFPGRVFRVKVRADDGAVEISEFHARTSEHFGVRRASARLMDATNDSQRVNWMEAIAVLAEVRLAAPIRIKPGMVAVVPLQCRMYQTTSNVRAIVQEPIEEHVYTCNQRVKPVVAIITAEVVAQ